MRGDRPSFQPSQTKEMDAGRGDEVYLMRLLYRGCWEERGMNSKGTPEHRLVAYR